MYTSDGMYIQAAHQTEKYVECTYIVQCTMYIHLTYKHTYLLSLKRGSTLVKKLKSPFKIYISAS